MKSFDIERIENLSTSAHDLLQGVSASPVKAQHTRVFKTVVGLLNRIDEIVDAHVTDEIKRLQEDAKPDEEAQGVALAPKDLLAMSIGILSLPIRLEIPLQKAGLRKVSDLAALSFDDLARTEEVGEAGAKRVLEAMTSFGFILVD